MKTNTELAHEVLEGKWGNGQDRRQRLTSAGYSYEAVQSIVNALVKDRDSKHEQDQLVENTVETVDNSVLKIDIDLTRYKEVELNIIID